MKNKSETFQLIEDELLQCEIGQSELYGYYKGYWQEIGVIDVIGITEEKATIYGGVIVEIGGIEKLISFKMFNKWVYIYKDEMIEVMEDLGSEIIKVFYMEVLKMNTTKEYNKLASEKNNMDIYNIYDNGREVLQYGIKYNQYTNMYDFYNLTDNRKITGLTYEKCDQVLSKEIEYQKTIKGGNRK